MERQTDGDSGRNVFGSDRLDAFLLEKHALAEKNKQKREEKGEEKRRGEMSHVGTERGHGSTREKTDVNDLCRKEQEFGAIVLASLPPKYCLLCMETYIYIYIYIGFKIATGYR